MNKLFKRAVAAFVVLAAILTVLIIQGQNKPLNVSQSYMTGWPYAVHTDIQYGYYTRILYCVNEATSFKWTQESFGINPATHGERCITSSRSSLLTSPNQSTSMFPSGYQLQQAKAL